MKHKFSWRNKMPVKGILAGLLGFALVAESRAGLAWVQPKLELTSQIGAGILRTGYCFTNTGNTLVTITSIRPSCGCVSTELTKFDYAPGQGGEIKVTFDLGMEEFAKIQKRTIAVTTSDAPTSPTVLHLLVHVPETVAVSPEALIWHRGEKPRAKEVVVKAGSGVAAIKLIQTAANNNFTVEVKPEIEGQRYRLRITPGRTDVPAYATIKFNVKSASFARRVDCEVNLNVE
jgi:hypothetical protein